MTAHEVRRYNAALRATIPLPLPVRALLLVLKLALFLLLLGLAARNSEFVTLRYFLGLEWQAPLSLVIFAAFAVGLVTGLLACSVRLLRNHRELRSLRKAAREE